MPQINKDIGKYLVFIDCPKFSECPQAIPGAKLRIRETHRQYNHILKKNIYYLADETGYAWPPVPFPNTSWVVTIEDGDK